jgi:hypothetical protein
LKSLYLSLFIALFFSGCIVKQTAATQNPNAPYDRVSQYNVPDMKPYNIQDRMPSQPKTFPTKEEATAQSDAQLQSLIEGSSTKESALSSVDRIDTKSVPVSPSPQDEIVTTQVESNDFFLPQTSGEVELIDTTKSEKSVRELEDNIINAEMKGIYGEFAYPVSIRKKHKFRSQESFESAKDEIETAHTPEAPKPEVKNEPTPLPDVTPSPAVASEASLNTLPTDQLSDATPASTMSEEAMLSGGELNATPQTKGSL